MRRTVLVAATTLGLAVGTALTAAPVYAEPMTATRVVTPGGTGVQAGTCQSGGASSFSTIQAAVDASSVGDIVLVCAGAYTESVVVNVKDLDIRGDNYGHSPNGAWNVPGTAVTADSSGPAFTFLSGGSSLEGFNILSGGTSGTGIGLAGGTTHITRNIIAGQGLGISSTDKSDVIEGNQFDGGTASGSTARAIQIADTDGLAAAGDGTQIVSNFFQGSLSPYAIEVSDAQQPNAPPATHLKIQDNVSGIYPDPSVWLRLNGTDGVDVSNNFLSGTTDETAVELAGGNNDYSLSANTFQQYGDDAVLLSSTSGSPANGPGSINDNFFGGNGYGVYVDDLDPGAELDVQRNYFSADTQAGLYKATDGNILAGDNFWGCNEGPSDPGCDQADVQGGTQGLFKAVPWIVLTSSVTKSTIHVGETTTMTAALTTDSDGHSVSAPVLDGTGATFAFPNGTAGGASSVEFHNGTASITFTGTTVGVADATATVDNAVSAQTITVEARVTPPPPPTLPALTIHDGSILEGNSGTHALTFKVTMSKKATKAVTVHFTTANGSAVGGSDFVAKSGVLTIAKGKTTGTITVLVKGDKAKEANETFFVNIFTPTNARIADPVGQGTIRNDDH